MYIRGEVRRNVVPPTSREREREFLSLVGERAANDTDPPANVLCSYPSPSYNVIISLLIENAPHRVIVTRFRFCNRSRSDYTWARNRSNSRCEEPTAEYDVMIDAERKVSEGRRGARGAEPA